MTIIPAQKANFAEITAVWEDSVRATHHFLTESDIEELRPKIQNDYLPAVDLRVYKNAAGKILGFIGVSDSKIEMLFVASKARGQGIGKKLVQYALTAMGVTLVDVNEQNPQATGFYQHMGFEVFSRSSLDGQGRPFPLLHMRLATGTAR